MDMVSTAVPDGAELGPVWSEKGRDQVAGIYVFHDANKVSSLQFLFYENDRIVKSKIHGHNTGTFSPVVFDYPAEFLTSICGWHELARHDIFISRTYLRLASIKFCTNRGSYGPYGCSDDYYDFYYNFNFTVERRLFGGFHGTMDRCVVDPLIESIGVYVKLPFPLKDVHIKDQKEED
ncbi:hypothetical protein CQW23_22533 [Capsicum baccatum]|uniref:Jacalin-type lectin domain-containing protein n=1 Tax=Capsicum baccatum TaxID=33114 RepID=A0A2G2W149_CAPBA|nr:hypothetical protein CQW23_22533 [Capsicum baccatum]